MPNVGVVRALEEERDVGEGPVVHLEVGLVKHRLKCFDVLLAQVDVVRAEQVLPEGLADAPLSVLGRRARRE